jgi:hypothetical protein
LGYEDVFSRQSLVITDQSPETNTPRTTDE